MSDSEASAEMDLNGFESSEQDVPAPKRQKIEPTKRIAYVRSLASVELQRFIDEPPGEGMAVIYVFVNLKDGKVYVGKHEHADGGKSFKATRCQKHLKPSPSALKTYFVNAVRKHGKEFFEYHIIWRGPEAEVDDQERFWIGPDGLHTIKDHGGLGYNTKEGGDGGRLAPSAIAKIKAAHSKPEAKAVASERAKKQAARETAEGKPSLAERANTWRNNVTPEERTEINRKISKAKSTPEAKAAVSERKKAEWANKTPEERADVSERKKAEWANKTPEERADVSERKKAQFASPEARAELSERAKAQAAREAAEGKPSLGERKKADWVNKTPEERADIIHKQLETKSKPEWKLAASERAKAQFASPEARAELSERGKAQFASPEARAELSERGKKQAEREAAEGKPSLSERGKATQIGNWTEEQRAAALAKIAATTAKKRADKLSTLSGVARERQEKKYERTDHKEKIRKAQANALLKLDKYSTMDYQWRYRNVGRVQKEDDVHFFPDANGVLCAAFKTQGEGSSSSS